MSKQGGVSPNTKARKPVTKMLVADVYHPPVAWITACFILYIAIVAIAAGSAYYIKDEGFIADEALNSKILNPDYA